MGVADDGLAGLLWDRWTAVPLQERGVSDKVSQHALGIHSTLEEPKAYECNKVWGETEAARTVCMSRVIKR